MILEPLEHICPVQLEVSTQFFDLQPVQFTVSNSYINRKNPSFATACIQTACTRITHRQCTLTEIFLLPLAEAFCSLWTCQAFRAWTHTRVRGGLLCGTPGLTDEGPGHKRGGCSPMS